VTLVDRLYLALVAALPIVRPFQVEVLGYPASISDLLFVAVASLWLTEFARGRRSLRFSAFHLALALYFVALSVATAAAGASRPSLAKLAGVAYLLALCVLTIDLVRSQATLRAVMRAWMAGASVTVAVSLAAAVLFYAGVRDPEINLALSDYGTLPAGPYPRVQSLSANPNMLSNYLTVSLAIVLIMGAVGWLAPLGARVLAGGVAIAGLLTVSPGLGGLALYGGLWPLIRTRGGPVRGLSARLIAGIVVAVLCFGATLVRPPRVSDAALYPSQRVYIWTAALQAVSERPLAGRGAGRELLDVQEITPAGPERIRRDAHNVWLSVGVQAGLPGIAALLCVVVAVARRMRARPHDTAAVAIVRPGLAAAFLVALLYDGLTGAFEDARHVWVLAGLVVSLDNAFEEGRGDASA
jgi:hypothetical protein